MHYTLTFICVLMCHVLVYGQCESDWVAEIGGVPTGSQAGLGYALCVYQDGSVLAGAHESRSDSILVGDDWIPGAGANPLNSDFYLVKYSSDGILLWVVYARGFGIDFAKDAALDPAGNVYVTGQFRDTLNFNTQNVIVSTGTQDMFLCRISVDGELQWVRKYGNSIARGVSVDVDENGVYMAGVFFTDSIVVGDSIYQCAPPSGQSDVVVMKHDLEGNLIWSRHITGEDSQQVGALSVNNGEVVLAGVYKEELVTPEQTLLGNSTYNYYLLDMHSIDGTIDWIQQSVGGGLSAIVENIVFDDQNNIYLSGRFNTSTIAFQNVQTQNDGEYDYFLLKTTSSGNPEWLISSNGSGVEVVYGMTISGSNLVVTGGFTQTSFDVGEVVLTNPDNTDVFLAQYNTESGVGVCGVSYHGDGVEQGLAIVAYDENLYVEGLFTENITLGEIQITPIGNQDLFLWKTCFPCDTAVGIKETDSTEPFFTLTPNPATTTVQINLSGLQPKSMTVTDMLGRAVQLPTTKADNSSIIDVSHLPRGMYVVTVTTENGGQATQKLLVE